VVASVIALRSVGPPLGRFTTLAVFSTTLMVSVGSSLLPLVLSDVRILQHMMIVVRRWLITPGRLAKILGRGVLGSGICGAVLLHLRLVLCLPVVSPSSMVSSVRLLTSPSRS